MDRKLNRRVRMTYSLQTVVGICAGAIDDTLQEREAWGRKSYVWRRLGKVLPDGPPYTRGAGAAKRYEAAAIPLIGVMLCIARRFSSVEVLDEISQELQRNLGVNRAFSRCWSEALAVAERLRKGIWADAERIDLAERDPVERETQNLRRIWLTIAFSGPVTGLNLRCDERPVIKNGQDVDIYCMDLGYIFNQLLEEGAVIFAEDFQLASPPRRGSGS
jgi:hypothetical protein